MRRIYWRLLIAAVLVIALGSYLIVFRTDQIEPRLLSMPVIFWAGIVLTILLVVLTFIGSRIFPYNEEQRP